MACLEGDIGTSRGSLELPSMQTRQAAVLLAIVCTYSCLFLCLRTVRKINWTLNMLFKNVLKRQDVMVTRKPEKGFGYVE